MIDLMDVSATVLYEVSLSRPSKTSLDERCGKLKNIVFRSHSMNFPINLETRNRITCLRGFGICQGSPNSLCSVFLHISCHNLYRQILNHT